MAIKKLAQGTDKGLFLSEVEIWRKLRYQHILREFMLLAFMVRF